MQVFFISSKISNYFYSAYYVSNEFINCVKVDKIRNVKTYYHLDFNSKILKRFSECSVLESAEHFFNLDFGKWRISNAEECLFSVSDPYYYKGVLCVQRKYNVIKGENPTDQVITKIYCELPKIYDFINDKRILEFLVNIYDEEYDSNFEFLLYKYSDNFNNPIGSKVDNFRLIEVPDIKFKNFIG